MSALRPAADSRPPTPSPRDWGGTFPEWIRHRASSHPDRTAVVFLDDRGGEQRWTYGELWRRGCSVADRLPPVAEPAPRGLLLFPPGIEFLAGFLGCQIAGWTPVPTCYPKPGREMPRFDSVATDCRPAAILGDRATLKAIDRERLCEAARTLPHVATDAADVDFGRETPEATDRHGTVQVSGLASSGGSANSGGELVHGVADSVTPDSLALLQYTSGSTSEPKGVMVRHRNLMANLNAIRRGFRVDWQSVDDQETATGVFWLPFFHDMGLIGGILTPLYVGGCTVLMSPRMFLQRPLRWLQAISDYSAAVSGAPNFAYQLCVDRISPDQTDSLDLSCWKTAFCGAEPILPRTLTDFANRFSSCGFRESSFYPCYGLAEATLLAAGGDGPAEPKMIQVARDSLRSGHAVIEPNGRGHGFQKLVSCGRPATDTDLRVVDPETHRPLADRVVGEIWLRGASVAAGYWGSSESDGGPFDARLDNGDRGYVRTGDLGFMHDGELFVTGRRKEVIILRGRNHFPQDIEATMKTAIGPDAGQAAGFSVEGPRGEALAVIVEVPRRTPDDELPELVRTIRRVVIEDHEVDPRHVLLVRQGTIPMTSSGKIRRNRCRELFDAGEIGHKYRYDRSSGSEQTPIAIPSLPSYPTRDDGPTIVAAVEGWLSEWLVVRAGVAPETVDFDKPFADYGLDSMTAVELSGELEDWSGVELTPMIAISYPTVSAMSRYIAGELVGDPDLASAEPPVVEQAG